MACGRIEYGVSFHIFQILDYKRLMDEVEKKKDMSNEVIKLNKQVSHLLHGFEGCYYKDGISTSIYETEAWQIQLKKIMDEHYGI